MLASAASGSRSPDTPGTAMPATNGSRAAGDLGGVCGPVRRVLLQQPGDKRLQRRRDLAAQHGDRGRLLARRAGSASRKRSRRRTAARPTSISYSTQPSAYRSAAAVTGAALACSGAMYLAVPTVTSGAGQRSAVDIVEDQPHAEVQHLHHAVRGEHHVGRLEVPVHYPARCATRRARRRSARRSRPPTPPGACVRLGDQRRRAVMPVMYSIAR